MKINKQQVLSLIIQQLEVDISVSERAVEVARDTATHKDCLGSSKYETMGTEASYLAQGQGVRLLELERAFAYFKQIKPQVCSLAELTALVTLEDDEGQQMVFLLAADAGGLKVEYNNNTSITIITPQAPLGKKLIGKHEGDSFELNIAGTLIAYEITNIQ